MSKPQGFRPTAAVTYLPGLYRVFPTAELWATRLKDVFLPRYVEKALSIYASIGQRPWPCIATGRFNLKNRNCNCEWRAVLSHRGKTDYYYHC